MNILGIDIGTTTVTALVLETEKSEILKSCTLKNDSFIEGRAFEKLQDPKTIIETVLGVQCIKDEKNKEVGW